MSETCDVVVIGAGLSGAATALALARQGLSVTVVEASASASGPALDRLRAAPPVEEDHWDARIYALSPGSRAFLESLGVWGRLDAARLAPVYRMEITGDDGRSGLTFSAMEMGVRELATIVEEDAVRRALLAELADAGVAFRMPAELVELAVADGRARVVLDSGETLFPRLVVGADGARSQVRRFMGVAVREKDYGQWGVVANFACERDHGGVARQWFRDDGILAWLPLPGRRMSMVWSAPETCARDLLACSPEALAARVAAAGSGRLGRLRVITAPKAFPLRLVQVERITALHVALVGDAAHQVHPLAGQGVNLGFADARALAGVLAHRGPRALGDAALLARYAGAVALDTLAMQAVTDGLAELFASPRAELVALRNLGLHLVDRLSPLKTLLARHALGPLALPSL